MYSNLVMLHSDVVLLGGLLPGVLADLIAKAFVSLDVDLTEAVGKNVHHSFYGSLINTLLITLCASFLPVFGLDLRSEAFQYFNSLPRPYLRYFPSSAHGLPK